MTVMEAERRARKWNQTTLAFWGQVSQSSISQFERRVGQPTPEQADRLAHALGVPVDALFRDVRQSEPSRV